MNERKNPGSGHDDDEDDPPLVGSDASLAADDPTAVWDADALREAGLDDLVHAPEGQAPPPATRGEHSATPSMITDVLSAERNEISERLPTQASPRGASGLSWTSTIALAVSLGAIVYIAIRLLR